MRNSRGRRTWVALTVAAGLVLAFPASPAAHEVPANVAVQIYVRPAGNRLTVFVRVPLESMRDYAFPTRGDESLDLAGADSLLPDAARQWIASYLAFFEDGRPLPDERIVRTRITLPSDRSYASFDSARALFDRPALPADTEIPWRQALLDVELEVPITSDRARFSVDTELAHLGMRTLSAIHYVTADGDERGFRFIGNPGLVRLDPEWHQAASRFVVLGFQHILDGIDHLLFLLCLVIPIRRFWPLVAVVTSFTVAHSITLIGSAFGLAPQALWFPPLVETLIALSIVYMAFENIVGARLDRRWLLAFAFGLVHGFGFSFVLSDSLQFAGAHLLTSLLAFNVGVELGQVLVIAVAVPALTLLFRHVRERVGAILLSALVAHTAWHWLTERGAEVLAYQWSWPVLDRAFAVGAMRALMLLLIVLGTVWLLSGLVGRLDASAAVGARREPALPDSES